MHAHAPTMTVQRIKSIGTGNLATIVEMGNYLGKARDTDEDSFLYQANQIGKNSIYIGTEVWLDHFEHQFSSVQTPNVGYDILDVDRNDNFILDLIDEKLDDDSLEIIVTHFVKIDHAGHGNGGVQEPEQFETALRGMDRNAKIFLDKINRDDTMLIAFGDHGQTKIGNHGGRGDDETATIMFFTQKEPFLEPQVKRVDRAQLELTSTFCNLLDSNLPFSNLGTFIPEILQYEEETTEKGKAKDLIARILINQLQILNYLKEYKIHYKGPNKVGERLGEIEENLNENLDEFFSTLDDETTYDEAIEIVYRQKDFIAFYIEILKDDRTILKVYEGKLAEYSGYFFLFLLTLLVTRWNERVNTGEGIVSFSRKSMIAISSSNFIQWAMLLSFNYWGI